MTLLVAALQAAGLTRALEFPLFDLRSRLFTLFRPEPTSDVVVVAIDDESLRTVGKWPWPRRFLAEAIGELERAGASVIALDLLHDDAQLPQLTRDPATGELQERDDDAILGAALAARRRTIQGMSFNYEEPDAPSSAAGADAAPPRRIPFESVFTRIASDRRVSFQTLMAEFLPGVPLEGALADDLRAKVARAELILALEPMASVQNPEGDAAWPPSNLPSPPVPAIARAAATIASVSFGGGDQDGAVRAIPLWIDLRGRLYPTLGLASALLHLNVPLSAVSITEAHTDIRLPAGQNLVIPTHKGSLRQIASLGPRDGLVIVPWPRGGFSGWPDQFARVDGSGARTPSEISLGFLLNPSITVVPAIQANIASLDAAMPALDALFGLVDSAAYNKLAAEMRTLTPDDGRWREIYETQSATWKKAVADAAALYEQARQSIPDPAAATPEERAALDSLSRIAVDGAAQIEQIEKGLNELDENIRKRLRERVRNKICFVGWTATGALADFVQTAVDSRTPGVHVHAALASAILTSVESPMFLAKAPVALDLAAVILLGVLGTMIGVRLGVVQSPLVLLAGLAAWFIIDGVFFFDWAGIVIAQAAPFAAAIASWLMVILHRLLVEQRSRKQTEARFRSYVSPDVVDILVNNPELDSMRPQRRELTIFFSDIAGWTTLAERLGTEGIYTFLATYLKAMTDILQQNRATIDKYLGDGIMAFWGAPIEDPDHAASAVRACILMQQKIIEMNTSGAFGPAGAIAVRMGIASGEVNVGDFGNPPYKSAYTVIGDAANLAARLESANKQFGSLILMTERTRTLAGISTGVRLIGRVIVKGKTEPETLWEPIGDSRPRGDRTAEWVALTTDAVQAYIDADFDRALALFDRLESDFADRELADKYRRSIADVRAAGGPGPEFLGTIVLTDK
ncbi:MAG: adenylate/guanylate cyclase domain-containing protein [Planctomycetota bacterium]|nr:adenylate/guanylate cyclase domain-containing protein [Planctomycetota bacterium]